MLLVSLAASFVAMAQQTQQEIADSLAIVRRDSLRALDRDTINGMIKLDIVGDVISGYPFTVTQAYPDSIVWNDTITINGGPSTSVIHNRETNNHRNAFRWYHIDRDSNKVRQIVVLREKWTNLPADLRSYSEAGKTIEAGYKLAALTPREYKLMKKQDKIWGECFEASWAAGVYNHNLDTTPNYPGMEIVCYTEDSLPTWKLPRLGPHQRLNSLEIMTYEVGNTTYLCAAPNHRTSQADYTQEGSDGKYHCRWMLCSKEESDYWWKKYTDWITNNRFVRKVMQWWKEI